MKAKCILTAAAAVFMLFLISAARPRLCFGGGSGYVFFCGSSSADCREVRPLFNAEAERLFLKDVCGECAEYPSLDLQAFLNSVNGQILFEEEVAGTVNYYCRADLPYSIDLYGEEVNLHICVREDGVKVASPIIFGGY